MIYSLYRYWCFTARPQLIGFLVKVLLSHRKIRIGRNLRAHGWPSINVEPNASLVIGDNVELRIDVEIRAHGESKIAIGDNVRIDRGVRVLSANAAQITIGSGVRIGLYSVLNGGDSISIGEKSLISGFVYLQTSMHSYDRMSVAISEQGFRHAPILLEKDVWLGAHVVVLPGVVICESAIVGSNAVVTASISAGCVSVGVPAKVISSRNDQ